jgi:hypothetical protein
MGRKLYHDVVQPGFLEIDLKNTNPGGILILNISDNKDFYYFRLPF